MNLELEVIDLLTQLIGFMMQQYTTFYSNLKAETNINKSDIVDVFESIYTTIISNILKYLGKISDCIIDSEVSHAINILKHSPQLVAVISNYKFKSKLQIGNYNYQID